MHHGTRLWHRYLHHSALGQELDAAGDQIKTETSNDVSIDIHRILYGRRIGALEANGRFGIGTTDAT